jgi:phosphate transport system substrate-binding protein
MQAQPIRRIHRLVAVTLPLAATALLFSACGSSSPSTTASGTSGTAGNLSGTLNGSGSSFQLVYQESAIAAFKSIQPNMTVNYGGGGSGKGRTDLASGTVNYAGSDSPVPSKEASNFTGKTVLYFPVVIAPITMSYNLPNVTGLKLNADVIAKIFQAQITSWNDPAIKALNPSLTLPSTKITIARRSDSSGTTANFSLYLQSAAPSVWKLGSSSTISWPSTSVGGNGNGGVASLIKSTTGAIGYVDYPDAKAAGLTYASVENMDGQFIAPSVPAAEAAVSNATVAPDLTFHAVWAPGAQSYPITYQSWVLVIQSQSAENAKLLKAWVGYLVGDGQKLLPSLNYGSLPASLQSKAEAQVSKIGS